ncbi:EAL domain-containing protein [Gordonia sinesedis]
MTSGPGRDEVIAPDARSTDRSAGISAAERYRLLLELSPEAIAVHQMGVIVYANDAAVRFARVSSRRGLVGRMISEFVHPDYLPNVYARMVELGTETADLGADGVPAERSAPASAREVVMVDGTGRERSAHVTSVRTTWGDRPAYQVMLRHPDAGPAGGTRDGDGIGGHPTSASHSTSAGHSKPASPLDSADTGHAAGPTRDGSDDVLAALPHAVLVVGQEGSIDYANPSAISLLGLSPADIPGLDVADLALGFPDEATSPIDACLDVGVETLDRTATISTPDPAVDSATANTADCVPHRSGSGTGSPSRRWLSCSCRALPADGGGTSSVLVSIADITDRHRASERLAWEASHDHLTGLLNRAGVLTRLESRLAALALSDAEIAVYYVDLDNFKLVNDSLSHSLGDEVLQAVARRMRATLSAEIDIGRIASDEFLLIAPLPPALTADEGLDDRIGRQAAAIHAAIDAPVEIGTVSERVTVSVGMTVADRDDTRTAEGLLRDAGIAMSEAKTAPRAPFVRFQIEHRRALQRRQRIEQDLRETLHTGAHQLRVVYQPIVTPRDQRVVAVEALVRWDHPELGEISPAEFIPVAEQSSLIDEVGNHVLRTATTEFAHHDGLDGVTLCVNISRPELTDQGLVARIGETLAESGLAPERLCIEITERDVIAENPDAPTTLAALRDLGVDVAIDDFGTGASSLNQLHRLPIGTLKLAESLVADLDGSERASAILTGVAQMARMLGVTLVAEGVETATQAGRVADIGCDLAQGFYYDVPRPLAEIGASD